MFLINRDTYVSALKFDYLTRPLGKVGLGNNFWLFTDLGESSDWHLAGCVYQLSRSWRRCAAVTLGGGAIKSLQKELIEVCAGNDPAKHGRVLKLRAQIDQVARDPSCRADSLAEYWTLNQQRRAARRWTELATAADRDRFKAHAATLKRPGRGRGPPSYGSPRELAEVIIGRSMTACEIHKLWETLIGHAATVDADVYYFAHNVDSYIWYVDNGKPLDDGLA